MNGCRLMPLHKERLVEFDAESGKARISPLGAKAAAAAR